MKKAYKFKVSPSGLTRLVDHFGTNAKLADALGVSRQVTDMWRKNGIPLKYADQLTKLTGLKARDIWPELYEMFNPRK